MSHGQYLTRLFILSLSDAPFYEDYRPDWLFGMELDFYFPDYGFAVEFNGDQHLFPTDLAPNPLPQILRDKRKRDLCKYHGINLVTLEAIDLILTRIRKKFKPFLPLKKHRENRTLNRMAMDYRKALIAKYDSPTCRKKGTALRGAAKKRRLSTPPTQTRPISGPN